MELAVQARISAKLRQYQEQTGIRIYFNHLIGVLEPEYTKIRKRKPYLYIYGSKGLVAKVESLEQWQQQVVTEVRKTLSPADIKAIWKANKIANFQPYT